MGTWERGNVAMTNRRGARTLPALTLTAAVALSAAAALADEIVDQLICEFTGGTPAQQRTADQQLAAYARVLDELLPGMAAERMLDREKPQQTWERICFYAGRAGAEVERAGLCRVMAQRLGRETPKPVRVWLLRQLERLAQFATGESPGRLDEVGSAVAALLTEEDGEIRELARRVLQNMPGETEVLRAALSEATTPEWRVALINALGARRDAQAVPQLAALCRADNEAVAAAAIAALADLGGRDATDELVRLFRERDAGRTEPVAAALLRVAQSLAESGQTARAANICLDLCNAGLPATLQTAAMCGLAAADSEQAIPVLLAAIRGQNQVDTPTRLLAVRLLVDSPQERVTQLLIQALPQAGPQVQAAIVDALGTRGGRLARSAVLEALDSSVLEVRLAAIAAVQALGDKDDVSRLVKIAASAAGPEREAARRALARLRGVEVEEVILAVLPDAAPVLRVELIGALSRRVCRRAVPMLFAEAEHQDESVCVAALEALGALCRPGDAPALIRLLGSARSEDVGTAAEDAIVAVCMQIEEEEERAGPVLEAWPDAPIHTRPALIRVLGRLGGRGALEIVRSGRRSDDPELVDAAVRALANWPTVEVLPDLLDVARHSDNKTHRVLALRGYIRLVGLPSEREPQATLAMYQTAMSLAEREEEKKPILGGLGGVAHLGALELAQQYLTDEALRAEAESAVVSAARLVGPWQREAARAAIERVKEQTTSGTIRERCDHALAHIRKSEGAVLTWVYSGPYSREDLAGEAVFEQAFAPELPGREQLQWQRLKVTNVHQPWVFELSKLGEGHDRCVYVHTAVWSEHRQEARLAVGSDDGVRVWFNARLVHEFRGARSHMPLQDTVPVTLNAGWNPLLLKVVQFSGQWRFSCALLDTDGEPLGGLKFDAVPP